MATGDAAAAVGFTPVPGTKDKRLGYDDINRLADFLAVHMVSGTHAFNRITGQATTSQLQDLAVTTPKLNAQAVTRAKIGDGAVGTPQIGNKQVTGAKVADNTLTGLQLATTLSKDATWTIAGTPLRLQTPNGNHTVEISLDGVGVTSVAAFSASAPEVSVLTPNGENGITAQAGLTRIRSGGAVEVDAVTVDLSTASASLRVTGSTVELDGSVTVTGSSFTADVAGSVFLEPDGFVTSGSIYSRTHSASANVYIDENGRLQRSTSSLRYKTDVTDAPEMPTVLAIVPRTWRDINAPEGDERRHYGAIAEELHELGLTHLVSYVDGEPEAIAYDRIAVALIPYVRMQHELLATVLDRLAALEAAATPQEG